MAEVSISPLSYTTTTNDKTVVMACDSSESFLSRGYSHVLCTQGVSIKFSHGYSRSILTSNPVRIPLSATIFFAFSFWWLEDLGYGSKCVPASIYEVSHGLDLHSGLHFMNGGTSSPESALDTFMYSLFNWSLQYLASLDTRAISHRSRHAVTRYQSFPLKQFIRYLSSHRVSIAIQRSHWSRKSFLFTGNRSISSSHCTAIEMRQR
jgi:hypothetical protein